MERIDQTRFPKWLRLTLAVAAALGAAFGFMVYVANGVVVEAIFGLPGREQDIAIAQHRGTVGMLSGVLLQLGVAGALFSYTDRENDRVARIIWAVVISLLVTGACGIAILFFMRTVR